MFFGNGQDVAVRELELKLNSQELYKYTPSDPIYKKIFKKYVSPIYKKMSEFLRYSYCLKDLSTPYLTFVFLILVGVFNVSHIFIRVYL